MPQQQQQHGGGDNDDWHEQSVTTLATHRGTWSGVGDDNLASGEEMNSHEQQQVVYDPLVINHGHDVDRNVAESTVVDSIRSTRAALQFAQIERSHWLARRAIRKWHATFLSFLFAHYTAAMQRERNMSRDNLQRPRCETARALLAAMTTPTGRAIDDTRVNWYCHSYPTQAASLFFVRALMVDADWRHTMDHSHAGRAANFLRSVEPAPNAKKRRCVGNGRWQATSVTQSSCANAAMALHATLDAVVDEWTKGVPRAPHYALRSTWRAAIANYIRTTTPAPTGKIDPDIVLREAMHDVLDAFFCAYSATND